jgi:hypothetical protein
MSPSPARFAWSWCLTLVLVAARPAPAQAPLIPLDDPQGPWRYLDDGSQPPAEWTSARFDDQAWRAGPAPLGYGEPDLRTTVSFGPDAQRKHLAVYFRRSVRVDQPDQLRQLVGLLRCDDAAVVYLNGREVHRFNLPPGAVDRTTPAADAVSGLVERLYHRFVIPADRLQPGDNLLAVEVHQSDAGSSDLLFDLALAPESTAEPARPTLSPQARDVARTFHQRHYLGRDLKVPDGYADGGRGMQIDEQGALTATRELIVVDRSRDRALQKHLAHARQLQQQHPQPLPRATELARYVDAQMNNGLDRPAAEPATGLLASAHRNAPVLLGDVPKLCGAGACRHRALLYKVLADEAGLDVALVRGNVQLQDRQFGHAWNELRLDDQRTLLVDTMSPPPDFRFPELTDPALGAYRTVDGQPWYPPAE